MQDEEVLRLVGDHLGALASRDLKTRCAAGLDHATEQWAERKRGLTEESSSRWAGSITKTTHGQWALARRGQLAHIQSLGAGVATITHRLSLPVGEKGSRKAPGGYRTRQEWFAKTRRLHMLADRLEAVRADREAGRVCVVRGGKRLHEDALRGRWYLTASWTIPPAKTVPLTAARANGLIGVDTNADHLAAWRLDPHGNPVGEPLRFDYDLTGTAAHRDAQVRHALIRLLHWATRHHLAIAVEDLDFQTEKAREKHGRRKRFRKLISGMPVSRLRARLVSMAAELGIPVVAVDPAYTSRWGAQHWQNPLTSKNRKTTRHDAAAVAIGRRALGHPIRRRTAPPPGHRSDEQGHRTVQTASVTPGREGPRPRIPGPRTRSVRAGRGANAGNQDTQHRSGHPAEHESWQQDSLSLSL